MRVWLLALLLCVPATARSEPGELAAARAATTQLTFAPGHASLSGSGRDALKTIANMMHAKAALQIVVIGHGEPDLAKRRAEVVKWFLVDVGVETDRIATRVQPAAGTPIELRFQPPARHHTPVARVAPAVPPATGAKPEVRGVPSVRHEPAPAHDVTSVVGLFGDDDDDTSSRRHVGSALESEIAALHDAHVTIGGGASSGFRDSSAPQLAVRPAPPPLAPLALSITSVVIVSHGPETRAHEDLARIRYRVDDTTAGAAMRARIRAQRRSHGTVHPASGTTPKAPSHRPGRGGSAGR